MNKGDLASALSEKVEMTKSDAASTIDALFEIITEQMVAGQEVRVTGFGTFTSIATKEREGRNPRTGEKMHIPASNQPKFKAFKALKDALNT
jgi:Bacterial nucleoid DNA-binding protein